MGCYDKAIQERRGLRLVERLGFGIDGNVYETDQQSAIKAFERQSGYRTERDVYIRLGEHGVREVQEHMVPQLLDFNDTLWVIDISVVRPPFLLDFAKSMLDIPPDFPNEVMEQWHEEKAEQFGDLWPAALSIMRELEQRYGVYLTDVNPGNIVFEGD